MNYIPVNLTNASRLMVRFVLSNRIRKVTLARVVALQEVIWMGESFMKGNQGYAGLVWPLFFTAVYYLVFSGVATILLGKLEKKLEYFR